MPELYESGDIFRADARAGFDEGIVRGKVGGGAFYRPAGTRSRVGCQNLRLRRSAKVPADALLPGERHLARSHNPAGQ
jgi:hypothetical protein